MEILSELVSQLLGDSSCFFSDEFFDPGVGLNHDEMVVGEYSCLREGPFELLGHREGEPIADQLVDHFHSWLLQRVHLLVHLAHRHFRLEVGLELSDVDLGVLDAAHEDVAF